MYRPANIQHAAIPNREAGNGNALNQSRMLKPFNFDAFSKIFATSNTPYAAVRNATKNNRVAGINPNRKRLGPNVVFPLDGGEYGSGEYGSIAI